MKARLPQGYGKQNVNQLMQQAQKLQEDMKAKQEEMEAASHTVTAGGGMVEITMTGAPRGDGFEVETGNCRP